MNTDKHGWRKANHCLGFKERESISSFFSMRFFKNQRFFIGVSLFICVHLWLNGLAFAGPSPTPSADSAFDAAARALDESKEQVQKFKDLWDKTRLETTLYDQRAKRAYKKWTKAVKGAREQAKGQKERAELEFQLAVEKRKLAYNEWQAAQLRMLSRESQVKALDQDKDSAAIREKIKRLEDKISPPPSAVRSPQKSTATGKD